MGRLRIFGVLASIAGLVGVGAHFWLKEQVKHAQGGYPGAHDDVTPIANMVLIGSLVAVAVGIVLVVVAKPKSTKQ